MQWSQLGFFLNHTILSNYINNKYQNDNCKYHQSSVIFCQNILQDQIIMFFLTHPSCVLWQEIVPLRKVCRRPETDYRLQQLHAMNESTPMDHQKSSMDFTSVHAVRVASSADTVPKQQSLNNVAAPQVLQATVSVAPQTLIVDQRKTEGANDMAGGNAVVHPSVSAFSTGVVTSGITPSGTPFPGNVPLGSTAFPSNVATSSVSTVSNQNRAEGK